MNRRFRLAAVTATVVVAFTAGVASAGSHEHARSGFFIGFGFGGGSAAWDWADGLGGGNESEGSGVGNFRLGGALQDNIILGLESSAWLKTWSDGEGNELEVTFSATTFGATFFPGNMGFFVRGGIGFGSAIPKVTIGGVSAETTDSGFAALGAVGYEWRLTQKFALGPQVELAYLAVDGDVFKNATIVDGALQFNWYW